MTTQAQYFSLARHMAALARQYQERGNRRMARSTRACAKRLYREGVEA